MCVCVCVCVCVYARACVLNTKACWLNRSKLLTTRHESEQKRTAPF